MAVNLLSLTDVRDVVMRIREDEQAQELSLKEKSERVVSMLEERVSQQGITLALRK